MANKTKPPSLIGEMLKELTLAYSPYGNGSSIYPFDAVFTYNQDAKVDGFKGVDAFLLWGGTDIHPSFYKAKPHIYSGAPEIPSERDLWEWKAMQHCKANNIPMIGVCRGAQFLCAFAGGGLIQHCGGHNNGTHEIEDYKGAKYQATSSHHQMMDVHGTIHELIASPSNPRSSFYYGETSDTPAHIAKGLSTGTFSEPEIVFFPHINALAIQGHPEWMNKDSVFAQKCNEYIVDFLFNKKEW